MSAASRTTWWAPLRRGLVVDPEAKHFRRLSKGALWLLLYFILHADRRTGTVIRKEATIASDTGLSARAIRNGRRRLRTEGYIRTARTGRASWVRVLRWPVVGSDRASQTGTDSPFRAAQAGQGVGPDDEKNEYLGGESSRTRSAHKSLYTRTLLLERRPVDNSADHGKGWHSVVAAEERLAMEIAKALGDASALPKYREILRSLPESTVRELLKQALAATGSKADAFRQLMNQHLHGRAVHPRH